MFQFRGLCLCFIYFCLCFCSLQNFLQFLDAQRFYPALQLSLCQKSPWHRGSLTPIATAGPSFYESKNWDRTEWDTSFLTAGSTWKRDCWHTQAAPGVVQTQDQSSQITQRLGFLVHKSIPSPCTPRQWCLYLSSPFLPIYKYLFSFPHQICMTDPARAGILQVKPG